MPVAETLLVVVDGPSVAVMLQVRRDYRRRHDVVLAARFEQQGRGFVPEVHVGVLVAWREVGESTAHTRLPETGTW